MNVRDAAAASAPPRHRPITGRIECIDIFRGLTVLVMVFVDNLDFVKGLPWWTYHMPRETNGMTYVDMVFPFFLFSLGLSLPIAIRQRLKKNPSLPALWGHTLLRSICLVVLGVILANAREGDPALMHLPSFAWTLLALLGMSLYLSVYNGNERHVALYRSLRIAGLILTIVMLTLFRRITQDGRVAWLDFSYLEILGLLGCTYFAVSLLYIPTRRWLWTPAVWFVLLIGFSVLCAARWFVFERHVPLYLWPFGDGTMAFIAMAGVVTANIFFGERSGDSPGYKLLVGSCFGMALLVAGRIFTSLGISKIRDTPTWVSTARGQRCSSLPFFSGSATYAGTPHGPASFGPPVPIRCSLICCLTIGSSLYRSLGSRGSTHTSIRDLLGRLAPHFLPASFSRSQHNSRVCASSCNSSGTSSGRKERLP